MHTATDQLFAQAAPPAIDDRGMMELAGAVVAQAAADYMQGRAPGARSNEYDPAEFLEAAGVLGRAAEIVAYSPRCAASTRRQGKGTGRSQRGQRSSMAA